MKRNKFFLLALFIGALSFGLAACEKEGGDDKIDETKGVIGKWYSSKANVAPLLRGAPFLIDSIYVEMKADFTYRVESYDASKVMTLYTGTFAQQKSTVGDIWTITLQQNVPFAGVSEGIFEVFWNENPMRMRYEVLQTTPSLNLAPPTPAGGFGSSAGGILGVSNVQVFLRIK